MNRIFVLGAAGFVGREVVKEAVARGPGKAFAAHRTGLPATVQTFLEQSREAAARVGGAVRP